MTDPDDTADGQALVRDLLRSHVGRAFLALAATHGLVAAAARDIGTAQCLAACACQTTNPWSGDDATERLERRTDELRQVAQSLVAPGGEPAGWSRALDPAVQRWAGTGAVVDRGDRPVEHRTTPHVVGSAWEAYAQLPEGWVLTDDEVVDAAGFPRSGSDEWLPHGLWDGPDEPNPRRVRRWRVAADVRVAEIDRPDDWAALVERFPGPIDRHAGRSLDWAALGSALDGVHLTLRGLLTATRPVGAGSDEPRLWAWTSTGTRWARPFATEELEAGWPVPEDAHRNVWLAGLDSLGDPRFEEGDEVDGSELDGAVD